MKCWAGTVQVVFSHVAAAAKMIAALMMEALMIAALMVEELMAGQVVVEVPAAIAVDFLMITVLGVISLTW